MREALAQPKWHTLLERTMLSKVGVLCLLAGAPMCDVQARVVVLQLTSCTHRPSAAPAHRARVHACLCSSLQARKESLAKDCGSLDEAGAADPEAAAAADAEDG